MPGDAALPPFSEGRLLGGRLRYAQPRQGYRTGIEPVLLAAAVPAEPGSRVLEAGTGAGAGLLCLSARVPGITGTGLEIEPAMVALAQANFAANGAAGLSVLCTDLTAPGLAARLGPTPFDHIFANPPWHDAAGSRPSDALRDRAKMAEPELLPAWLGALAPRLRPGGSLTLILPAASTPSALALLAACRLGSPLLYPLWPRAGRPARIVLIQARKGGRAPFRLATGLVLHEGPGYSPEAGAVLRDGAAIDLRRGAG